MFRILAVIVVFFAIVYWRTSYWSNIEWGDKYLEHQDYVGAFNSYLDSCKTNNKGYACYMVGQLYENGLGCKKNPKKALEFYGIACQNYGTACKILGDKYANTDEKKSKKFYIKSLELLPKECMEEDILQACAVLGETYYYGDGTERNQKKSIQYFAKACDLGDKSSCDQVAKIFENGEGVKINLEKAMKYYEKANKHEEVMRILQEMQNS